MLACPFFKRRIRRADAPRTTLSMRTAMRDLRLEAWYVVYPGPLRYRLDDAVEAVPVTALTQVPPWT